MNSGLKMVETDILVVGGGPAGVISAFTAATVFFIVFLPT